MRRLTSTCILILLWCAWPVYALDLRPTVSPWLEDGTNIYQRVQRNVCIGIGPTATDALSLCTSPVASATRALFNLSNTALSGGSVSGTYVGGNPAACTGDFLHLQVANTTQARLTCGGAWTLRTSLDITGANGVRSLFIRTGGIASFYDSAGAEQGRIQGTVGFLNIGTFTTLNLGSSVTLTDAGAFAGITTLTTSAAIRTSTTIATLDPTGGAGPVWKLGLANVVSPTAPNRTITIDIAGALYYVAAKTTND